jgi:hypothetical protein
MSAQKGTLQMCIQAVTPRPPVRLPSAPMFTGSDDGPPEFDDTSECSACWGAELHGGADCPLDFVPGKLHFKNKFCDECRTCILVPLAHVRALSREQAVYFVNKRSEGFWNRAPANLGGGAYRIVNNTAGCVGPWLAIFREAPPYSHWPATARSNPQPEPCCCKLE